MPQLTILGATGNQGRGLLRALHANSQDHPDKDPDLTIHAITRNPSSEASQSLLADFPGLRIRLVPGDVYRAETLREGFRGADALFAMTHNRLPPGQMIETEDDLRHELVAGRNVVDVAKEFQIPHVILSSLPNLSRASHGRFTKVFHFDHKNQIEEWARQELPAVTVLYPGLYYSNLSTPQYCRRTEDNIVRFCAPCPPSKPADWVDPAWDIGVFAAKIFHLGPQKTASKIYPVVAPKVTFADMARTFSVVTGQQAVFEPISLDEWGQTVARAAGKGYERDIRQMMEWIAVAPREKVCYGTMDEAEDLSGVDLGVRASTFEEWLIRSGWKGPSS